MKTIYIAFDGEQFDDANECAAYEKEREMRDSSIGLFDVTGEPFDPKRIMGAENKSLMELVEYAHYICFDKKDYLKVKKLLECYECYFEEQSLLEENNVVYYDVAREGYVLFHQEIETLRSLLNLYERNMNTILKYR